MDDCLDDCLNDPSGARRDNLLRLRRLERLNGVDPTLPLGPALAVARGLDRVRRVVGRPNRYDLSQVQATLAPAVDKHAHENDEAAERVRLANVSEETMRRAPSGTRPRSGPVQGSNQAWS